MLEFLLSCGLTYSEALRAPRALFALLWESRERRVAHEQADELFQLKAVGGLQSELEQTGGRKEPPPKNAAKWRAKEFEERLRNLQTRGYKRQKRPLTQDEKDAKRRAQIAAFIGSAGDPKLVKVEVKDAAPLDDGQQESGSVLHAPQDGGQGGAAGGGTKARRKRRSPRPKSD